MSRARKLGREKEYEQQKRWRERNADHVREYGRAYQKANREKINAKVRERTDYKNYYERNGRKCHLKKKYGITVADYDRLFEIQLGKCAICKTDNPGQGNKHFHIDHDHLSGKVRGLLCVKCNMGIGSFDDDVMLMHMAAAYVAEAKEGSDPNDYES